MGEYRKRHGPLDEGWKFPNIPLHSTFIFIVTPGPRPLSKGHVPLPSMLLGDLQHGVRVCIHNHRHAGNSYYRNSHHWISCRLVCIAVPRTRKRQRRLSHPTEHPTTQLYRMKFQGPLLVSFQSTGGARHPVHPIPFLELKRAVLVSTTSPSPVPAQLKMGFLCTNPVLNQVADKLPSYIDLFRKVDFTKIAKTRNTTS